MRSGAKTVAVTVALAAVLGGCSGDSSTGPSYESIAGSYFGNVGGISQGILLDASVSFTIAQSGKDLSGTWSLSATLTDGVSTVAFSGTGTIAGTIASGNNPSVNITVFSPACPNYRANFSGAYDVPNRRITMTGPLEFFASNSCTVALSYQLTLIVNR